MNHSLQLCSCGILTVHKPGGKESKREFLLLSQILLCHYSVIRHWQYKNTPSGMRFNRGQKWKRSREAYYVGEVKEDFYMQINKSAAGAAPFETGETLLWPHLWGLKLKKKKKFCHVQKLSATVYFMSCQCKRCAMCNAMYLFLRLPV